MAPKKKGKGKGKKKKGGIADDVDPAEKNFILQAEIESLQMRLVRQQEESNVEVSKERDVKAHDKINRAAFEEEKQTQQDIVADMTRQYKATQDELVSQEADLQRKMTSNEEELKRLTEEQESII